MVIGGRFFGKTGANHGLASDILTLARSDDVADDDFIHGDFLEIVGPLGILLFNGRKAFAFAVSGASSLA